MSTYNVNEVIDAGILTYLSNIAPRGVRYEDLVDSLIGSELNGGTFTRAKIGGRIRSLVYRNQVRLITTYSDFNGIQREAVLRNYNAN